jgi:hypothetical protein
MLNDIRAYLKERRVEGEEPKLSEPEQIALWINVGPSGLRQHL